MNSYRQLIALIRENLPTLPIVPELWENKDSISVYVTLTNGQDEHRCEIEMKCSDSLKNAHFLAGEVKSLSLEAMDFQKKTSCDFHNLCKKWTKIKQACMNAAMDFIDNEPENRQN